MLAVAPAQGGPSAALDPAARWAASGQQGLAVAVVADRGQVAERPARDGRNQLAGLLLAIAAAATAAALWERAAHGAVSRSSLHTAAACSSRGPPSRI